LLKQPSSITVYRLPTKETHFGFPFVYAANKRKLPKRKTEAEAIFLNPFTLCSSCKRKFVVCPFVDEETNESYLFANGLNGLYGINGLAHLWSQPNINLLVLALQESRVQNLAFEDKFLSKS
jgi:hypothetical protein